ncbi:hypothetical protein ACQ86O_27470 (plasmid) [Serratia sp. L9]
MRKRIIARAPAQWIGDTDEALSCMDDENVSFGPALKEVALREI